MSLDGVMQHHWIRKYAKSAEQIRANAVLAVNKTATAAAATPATSNNK